MQRLDDALELAHLIRGRRVKRVRREVADRRIAPVVGEAAVVQELLVDDVMDRQQLDRRHAERLEIVDRSGAREPAVATAQVLAHLLTQLREPLDVHLVDHGLVPRRARPSPVVVLPVERRVDHERARDRRCGVRLVNRQVGVVAAARHVRQRVRGTPVDRSVDRLRVRVDQQLRPVEPAAGLRVVRAVDAVAVALPRPDPRQVAVPVERGALVQLDALFPSVLVIEAELDALRVLGEEREVRPVAVPVRAERERLPRPDGAGHVVSSTVRASKSATSVARPRRSVNTRPSTATSSSRGNSRRRRISSA